MSEIAKGLSQVSGIAASVLKLIPGGQAFAAAAAAISLGASAVAELTAKQPFSPPPLQDYTIGADQPFPYGMGRCQSLGHMVHVEAHGRTRDDVPNPWRTETYIYCGAGPVEEIQTLYANSNSVAFNPADSGFETGYYDKYMRADTQLGADAETTALDSFEDDPSPPTITQWNSTRKLSSWSAAQFSMLLDDVETHYRHGPPKYSVVGKWVKGYDPRLDDTYEGGAGAHRLGTESTYTYHVNPALHALLYAYGRYKNGVLVCGGGLDVNSIDIPSFVDCANTADANGWEINGFVFENGEDGEIWNNLKQMLKCAAAYPTNDKGVLRCIHQAARVSVDTITQDDIVGPCSVIGMTPWAKAYNTVIPKYTSEDNDWSYVGSDAIAVGTLETAQGEKRTRTAEFPLVVDKDQAAQLGVYDVYDSVEPIVQLTVSRRFIAYDIGDAFTLDLVDALGLDGTAYVVSHEIDIETGNVSLGLKRDTSGKHDYALGRTGTAPDHPALVSNADLDLAAGNALTATSRSQAVATSYVGGMTGGISSADAGSDATISIPAHTRVYGNPAIFPNVSVNSGSVAGLAFDTSYYICYDDPLLEGGSVTYEAKTDPAEAYPSQSYPYRHYVGTKVTLPDGGADTGSTPSGPSGGNDDWDGEGDIP